MRSFPTTSIVVVALHHPLRPISRSKNKKVSFLIDIKSLHRLSLGRSVCYLLNRYYQFLPLDGICWKVLIIDIKTKKSFIEYLRGFRRTFSYQVSNQLQRTDPSNSKGIANISKAVITLLANLFYNTSATPLSTAYKYISIYTLGCLCSDITVHIHNCRALDVLPRISWNIMRLRGCGCLFTKCAGSTGSIYTPKSAHKTSDIYEEDTGCKELFN